MSSYQPSAEMPLITHGSFREISIAQLSGDYLLLCLVLERVIKNKQYGPFSLLPKNPASQEVDDLSLDQDSPYFILRHNSSAMIPFHMFRPVKLSVLR